MMLAAMFWWMWLIGPDGGNPWLFRGGFLVTSTITAVVIAAITLSRLNDAGSWRGGNSMNVWSCSAANATAISSTYGRRFKPSHSMMRFSISATDWTSIHR